MCAKFVYWERECEFEKYGAGKKTFADKIITLIRNLYVLIYSPNTQGLFSVCNTLAVCVCSIQTPCALVVGIQCRLIHQQVAGESVI